MKNIKVYFFNVNSAKIYDNTKTQLLNNNCEFIDVQQGEYEDIGFLTEPLCGYEAEKLLSEKYLIKIDLDMQIVKPISKELIEMSDKGILIEGYKKIFELSSTKILVLLENNNQIEIIGNNLKIKEITAPFIQKFFEKGVTIGSVKG